MGRKKDNTKHVCLGRHFTWEERIQLEYLLCGKGGYKKIKNRRILAEKLNKSERTIYREISRGMVKHIRTEIPFEVMEYSAEFAQIKAELEYSAKGPDYKIGRDYELVKRFEYLIGEACYSPYAAIAHLNNTGWPSETRISEKTLYNYVKSGNVFSIGEEALPREGKVKKNETAEKRHSNAKKAEHSISNRPEHVNKRTETGHWEIDTVVGKKKGSKNRLLTMTERHSRVELIKKLPDGSSSTVNLEIDKLEKSFRTKTFSKVFKSITSDNGSEFSDVDYLKTSVKNSNKQRFDLYYAHPYCSSERGSNENANGIIRRFIKKGSDISKYSDADIFKIQTWMNNYPRKILGGKTPIQVLQERNPDVILPSFLLTKLIE